jgi:hypothetical protein
MANSGSNNPLDRPSLIKHFVTQNGRADIIKLAGSLGMALAALLVMAMFLWFIDRARTRVEAMHAEVANNQRTLLDHIAELQYAIRRVEERQMKDPLHNRELK